MSDAVWIAIVGQVGTLAFLALKAHVDNQRYRRQLENSHRAAVERAQIKRKVDENTFLTAGHIMKDAPEGHAQQDTMRVVAGRAFDRLLAERSPDYQGNTIGEEAETGAFATDPSSGQRLSQSDR